MKINRNSNYNLGTILHKNVLGMTNLNKNELTLLTYKRSSIVNCLKGPEKPQ